jgi:DNA uptake protein ComE-like DNA-binding protein
MTRGVNMAKITEKGIKWEIINSLWIIFTLTYFLCFFAFIWIGVRAKYIRWIITGAVYFLLTLFLGFFSTYLQDPLNQILIFTSLFAWIASIIHAFICRKKYLIRREIILEKMNGKSSAAELRERIRREEGMTDDKPFIPVKPDTPAVVDSNDNKAGAVMIDVNTCSESELTKLPGVSVVSAKKIIKIRAEKGGFTSFDDFIQAAVIAPHFAVQIEPMVTFSSGAPQSPQTPAKGRVIDI